MRDKSNTNQIKAKTWYDNGRNQVSKSNHNDNKVNRKGIFTWPTGEDPQRRMPCLSPST